MAIDRPLATPESIFSAGQGDEPDLEIEIVNPDSVSIETEDGGMIIDFDPEMGLMGAELHDSNLAEFIDEGDLYKIASDLVGSFKADKESRSDWERTYVEGLDLLGLKHEDRTTPWDGACGVFHPLLTESVIKFQSQAIQELFPAGGPVKTSVVGTITLTKRIKRIEFKTI